MDQERQTGIISRRKFIKFIAATAFLGFALKACRGSDNLEFPCKSKTSDEQIASQMRIEGALSYMETSGNPQLIKILQYITQQQLLPPEERAFQITSKIPSGQVWKVDPTDPIDLYFKPEMTENGREKKITGVKADLVVCRDFLDKNSISDEELAVIIAQKTRVYTGFRETILAGIMQEYSPTLDIHKILSSKDELEVMLWWGIANQVIYPLAQSGKLVSDRLRVLIPKNIPNDINEVDPSEWQNWAASLPPTILPGLSKR